jgi:transposase-like protein
MGQILHRRATTTEAIRRAIQHSQESLRTLSRRHCIDPKTVAKWRKRSSTTDHRTGPTVPKSTVLSIEQEAIILIGKHVWPAVAVNADRFHWFPFSRSAVC